uniref:Uncharacterized protein n=1 Tax=Wuchereria bancrofti TaxID=6293 RepID=A0A1I8EWL1_WUCBA
MESSTARRPTPAYFKPAPSEIQYGRMSFLITDRPSDLTINTYIELEKHNARAVVRVCEPTYATTPLIVNGIDVLDWEFDDGSTPPPEQKKISNYIQINALLALCSRIGSSSSTCSYCAYGSWYEIRRAVDLIRRHRRGVLNQKQLNFLQKYRSTRQLRKLRYNVEGKPTKCSLT